MTPKQTNVVKRTRLTLKEKFNLIQDHKKEKMNIVDLMKKYKCGKAAVYNILNDEQKVVDDYMKAPNADMKSKGRVPKFDEIDTMTYNWLGQVLAKKLPISGIMIQEKAKEFAETLNETEFKASNGWLEKFKSRHRLVFANICGESGDVPTQAIDEFLEKLPEIIAGYKMEDIANCDETGLFYRAIPKKTICLKGEKCHGGKQSKERLTVMLCCFADGTFEKPIVIGKSQKPRCFKKMNVDKLPVIWKANKKAWMKTDIMEQWLIRFNRKMSVQNRHILLFMDNATSHPNLSLSNITLVFLPPNTTSRIQPLDQGIINSFKIHYRTKVMKRLLSRIDEVSNVFELAKSINCLDAIYWIHEAVEEMPKTVVPNCFKKAGFVFEKQQCEIADDGNGPLRELRVVLQRIQSNTDNVVSAEEFVNFDDDILTESETFFESNKTNIISETVNQSDDSESDDDDTADNDVTKFDALLCIDQLKAYACKEGLDSLYAKIAECANIVNDAIISKHSKQSTIEEYFTKK